LNETDGLPHSGGMDLEPGYRELPPPAALREALACLWVRVVPAGDAPPTRVLPDACVDLVWHTGGGAFVAGPDTGPVVTSAPVGAVFVGARFRPGAGGPALGHPLSDLRDRRIAMADLWPDLDRRLPPTLTPGEALRGLTAIAAERAALAPPDHAVGAAVRRLADPRARVEPLAGDLGLSERQLRRRCHATVGYGPKTLQRVLRFRRFVALTEAGGAETDLAGVALESGYADQAHLTRECTRLAGMAPAAFAHARAGGR
jgi:AraC-like DNA-binding protein